MYTPAVGDRVTYVSLVGPETGTVVRPQSRYLGTYRVKSDRGPTHVVDSTAMVPVHA